MSEQMPERIAFDKWRGPCPVIGYTRAYIEWGYETEKLWECWQAARRVTPEHTALMKQVRGALRNLRRDAIILRDDYLAVFASKRDDDTLQGFAAGRWRQLAVTAKDADKALAALDKMEGR
jgi:hypothetical protein